MPGCFIFLIFLRLLPNQAELNEWHLDPLPLPVDHISSDPKSIDIPDLDSIYDSVLAADTPKVKRLSDLVSKELTFHDEVNPADAEDSVLSSIPASSNEERELREKKLKKSIKRLQNLLGAAKQINHMIPKNEKSLVHLQSKLHKQQQESRKLELETEFAKTDQLVTNTKSHIGELEDELAVTKEKDRHLGRKKWKLEKELHELGAKVNMGSLQHNKYNHHHHNRMASKHNSHGRHKHHPHHLSLIEEPEQSLIEEPDQKLESII